MSEVQVSVSLESISLVLTLLLRIVLLCKQLLCYDEMLSVMNHLGNLNLKRKPHMNDVKIDLCILFLHCKWIVFFRR